MASTAISSSIPVPQTLFDDKDDQLNTDQIIELCAKIGLIRENKCQILCDKDKKQCLNVASTTTTDGVNCCITHSKATKNDIASNAIPCRFIFPAEVELRKTKNTIDTTPKSAQKRCHGISKRANNTRCQNACVNDSNFCTSSQE